MTAPVELGEPNRQSPIAVIFLAVRTIRQIGFIQILIAVGFVLSRSPSLAILFVIVGAVGLVLLGVAALRWWRYTFAVVEGELRVEQGVVSHRRLSVPLERVQSVSIEQKLLHRLLGLVQVSVDTAGTQEAEFTIDAIPQPVAQAVQQVATEYRNRHVASEPTSPIAGADPASAESPAPTGRVILRHQPRRVLEIALTQMPFTGLILVAPLIAIADDINTFIPFDLPQLEEQQGWSWLLWAVPAFIAALILASVVLNVIRVFLTDWDLTLTSTASGLRRDAGLLSRTSVASSVPRIQRFGVSQGVVESLASLHTVSFDTVGSAKLGVPGCDDTQVAELRSIALGGSAGVATLDRRVSPQQVFLTTRNASIGAVIVAGGLFVFVGWWALLTLVLIPLEWHATRRRVRLRRWGITNEAVADRHEFLGWSRQELVLHKVNGVSVRQGLFERGRDLATVNLQTASGSINIGMIPLAEANAVRDLTLYVVETDPRAWM